MTHARGRWLANLGLLAVSAAVSLVAVEIILRVLYPSEPVFVQEHPELGFANIPGKVGYWVRETDEPVRVEINSKMLRDLERPYEKPIGAFRILMLGDSFIGAFNVAFERIASRQLEGLLRDELGRDGIEVINAGTQGWGAAQELVFWRTEGVRYQPDVVVLNFFLGNDFRNSYAETAAPTKPRFSVEEGRLVFHPPATDRSVSLLRDSVLARSALARTIRRGPLIEALGLHRRMASAGLVSSDGAQVLDEETMGRMIDVSCLLLERMDLEVRETGADFLVHVIPGGVDLLGFLPPDARPEHRQAPEAARTRRIFREGLLSCLEEHAIPAVFEWDRMVEDTRQGILLFADGVGHWTSKGNRRAAEDLTRALLPVVRERLASDSRGDGAPRRGS